MDRVNVSNRLILAGDPSGGPSWTNPRILKEEIARVQREEIGIRGVPQMPLAVLAA